MATWCRGWELPAGSYSQLRLILSGAYLEVETASGTMIYASSPGYEGLPPGAVVGGTLQLPSMGQSGLKIDLPGGRIDIGEGETILMLDFDAAESFGRQAGNSGKWVMHPVIKASNVAFGGGVVAQLELADGVELPELAGELVTLAAFKARLAPVAGGDTIEATLSDADDDGVFQAAFRGLPAGDYSLSFVGPAGLLVSFAPALPVTVTVAERQTTTQLVTLATAAVPGSVTARSAGHGRHAAVHRHPAGRSHARAVQGPADAGRRHRGRGDFHQCRHRRYLRRLVSRTGARGLLAHPGAPGRHQCDLRRRRARGRHARLRGHRNQAVRDHGGYSADAINQPGRRTAGRLPRRAAPRNDTGARQGSSSGGA